MDGSEDAQEIVGKPVGGMCEVEWPPGVIVFINIEHK